MKLERRRSRPLTFQLDVFEIVANKLADPRQAVEVWNVRQEKARLTERLHHRGTIELAMLEAHRSGRDPDVSIVQRSHQGVAINRQLRACQFLGKAPELASAGNRRMI